LREASMKTKQILCGSMVAAAIATGFSAGPVFGAAAPAPKGLYATFDYVEKTTGTGCPFPSGTFFNGHLDWPGAGKTGMVWRYGVPTGIPGVATANSPQIETITGFPRTPKASSKSWSGSETHVFEPSGITEKSTFDDGVLTYINSVSFVLERSVTSGKCTTVLWSTFIAE
jgi:hypothetical protein